MKRFFVIFLFSLHNCISAQETKISSITGLDISVDFGYLNTDFKRELFILHKLVPEKKAFDDIRPDYAYTSFITGYHKINAELVFAVKPIILKKHFYRQEFKFGISEFLMNTNSYRSQIRYDSINSFGITYRKNVRYNYYHHQEQVHATYLFNSRTLKNTFRAYFGLGASFGLASWRGNTKNRTATLTIDSFRQENIMLLKGGYAHYPMTNDYSAGSVTMFAPLGIKYNLSCDLNLFSDLKYGIQYQPAFDKGIRTTTFISFCLGVRYKFNANEIEEEAETSFW